MVSREPISETSFVRSPAIRKMSCGFIHVEPLKLPQRKCIPHGSHWQKMYIFWRFKKWITGPETGEMCSKKCSTLFFPNMGIKPMFDETYHRKRLDHRSGNPWGNDLSEELPDTRPLGLELVELRVVRVAFGMLRDFLRFVWKMGKWEEYCKWRDIYVYDVIWVHHEYSWIFSLYHLNGYWCYSFYGWVSLIHKESFPTLPLQKRFGNDGRCTPGEPNMVGRCTSGKGMAPVGLVWQTSPLWCPVMSMTGGWYHRRHCWPTSLGAWR